MVTPIESAPTLEESGKVHSRDANYRAGSYQDILKCIPDFELRDFKAPGTERSNPYFNCVNRIPDELYNDEIPVGIVSKTYGLVTHRKVLAECYHGLQAAGISTEDMRIELGLSKLGEWMNLRFYLPKAYDYVPADGHPLKLRLEAFNSVDGSSRFKMMLSWFRLICSNGMMIRETLAEFSDVHDAHIDLSPVSRVIVAGLKKVPADLKRLKDWESRTISEAQLRQWVDGPLAKKWGVKMAARIYAICLHGRDAKFADPFAKGSASEKPMQLLDSIPGSPATAGNFYHVAQAMSWAAGQVNDLLRREKLLFSIEDQLKALAKVN